MEYKQIQELIKTINKSNISELTVEEGDFKITIKQSSTGPVSYVAAPASVQAAPAMAMPAPQTTPATAAASSPAPAIAPVASNLVTIKSPMIGTFYTSPSPGEPPFVKIGDEVKVGQILCIINAMKINNEIESEVSGRIIEICVKDSSPVDIELPLFLVEPN
jgi:acetyl-CoA carboxylase biotin carboxyl carrier protein